MNNIIIFKNLNDKYFKKYTNVFNYSYLKFNLINNYLLFNFIYNNDNKICNYKFNKFNYHEFYYNIFMIKAKYFINKDINIKFQSNYENYIIDKFQNTEII